jgi:predicted Zn-dependent peptidase
MKFEHKTLPNGLTIVGETNPLAQSAAIGFFVRTGSRDETPAISGVSHFLEHMVFKGTDKLSPFEVNELFDKTGAKFNAFTSEENTVYYAAILPEYLSDITALWSQLMRPSLRDEDFNMEKNVIKEEIAMYKDLPHYDVMDRARSLHFAGHPAGNSVLGTDQSIDALTAAQMKEYFSRRYAPNNIVVTCTGNLDFPAVTAQIESFCGSWQSYQVDRKIEYFSGTRQKNRIEKPNLVSEHLCLVSAAVSAQDKRRFAASLLSMIVGDDSGSRFFWQLVDNALCETASMQYEAMDGVGALYSFLRFNPENNDKVSATLTSIFTELEKSGITADELQKAKNKLLSGLVIKNELPMGRLTDVGFNWVYLKQYKTIDQEIAEIKAVTVDDVNAFIKEFTPSQYTQLALSPAQKA